MSGVKSIDHLDVEVISINMKAKNPFTYKISEAEKICYVTAEGQVTLQSCVELMEESIEDPKTKPGYRALVDLRKMKYYPEITEIYHLTSYITAKKEYFRGKVALVTAGHRNRALADMVCFGAAMGGMDMRRFTNMDDARKWFDEPVNKKIIKGE